MRTFTKRLLASTWIIAAVVGGLAIAARAATYNFYFNNTEQGDNSTANPSVLVHDGKTEKKPGVAASPVPAPEAVVASPAAAAPTTPPAVAASAVAESTPTTANESSAHSVPIFPIGSPEVSHVRLTLGVSGFLAGGSVGPMANFGLFANRYVGINGFAGYMRDSWGDRKPATFGAELELTPLHIPAGGNHPDFVGVGLLFGASNVFPAYDNLVSPHVGGRVSFNFGNYLSVTGAIRGNAGYQMIDGGLAVRI